MKNSPILCHLSHQTFSNQLRKRYVAANLSDRVSQALLDFMIMAVLVPTYHNAVTDSQQLFPTSFEGGLRQHDICSRLLAICITWSRE